MAKTVVVIGAGLAGIQVSQQLVDLGLAVHLVEKESIVGGLSTYLGKVFPTDDCALCLDASEELFSGNHRRCQYRSLLGLQRKLTVHTLTKVRSIKREENHFSVSIRTNPRYVLLDRCVVCLECLSVCDVEVPDDRNLGRSMRKAIDRAIPQGIPQAPVIDMDYCTKCNKCIDVCGVNAIDLSQKTKTRTIKADAVIVTTGADELVPDTLPGYAYTESPNVLTQKELARLLDPAGPSTGEVLTASGKPVDSVTMILCAGSRDLNFMEYCSQACCTYSLKHAILLRESGIAVTICYMDLRVPLSSTHYLERAREVGVRFLRGKPDHVNLNHDLLVTYVEDTQTQKTEAIKSQLVVLASPLVPLASEEEYLTLLVDRQGFATRNADGFYACGTATGPKDIPTSIAEANSIALQVYIDLEVGR